MPVKSFYPIGIGAAFVTTARPEKRKQTIALIIPTALTAMLTGITEPFEFTFLFLAPQLFVVHALLTSTFAMTIYTLGVSGNIGGGLIGHITGFVIPLLSSHLDSIIIYHVVGLVFVLIYFVIFRWAILRFDIRTPGREAKDEDIKMYSKSDYRERKNDSNNNSGFINVNQRKAAHFLEGLGGSENIQDVTNCVSRLRLNVKDESKVKDDDYFKQGGPHGIVRKGKGVQVIVGMEVPKVREFFDEML